MTVTLVMLITAIGRHWTGLSIGLLTVVLVLVVVPWDLITLKSGSHIKLRQS
jgi:hypothetical protein